MYRNAGINRVFLTGVIENDVNLEMLRNNPDNIYFSILTSETFVKNGKQVEHLEHHKIVMPTYIAKPDLQYFKKGALISIEGKMTTYLFTDDENIKRYNVEILVTRYHWLTGLNVNKN
ncbi:single-stranded DNA-binding protein [Mucilaginibacter sp. PAMB04274]|uniref:single-stranded DNA-binding protein n=1 Tax=Mucilaginibacter sp. PAMB04274 TaxID=3138568 RepID=UPI0031F7128D